MALKEWNRRNTLTGVAALALTGCATSKSRRTFVSSSVRAFKIPNGACDSHLHIYDQRFPYLPAARLRPPPATATDYRTIQKILGTSRCVVVQPSSYGADNACTVDALNQLGDSARGVIMCRADLLASEMRRFDDAGVRGIRISGSGLVAKNEIVQLAHRIADLGWHLQFSMSPDSYLDLKEVLLNLPTNIVIDHFGRVRVPESGNSEHYLLMRRLLDAGKTWIKLSSPYTNSLSGPPEYSDVAKLARDFISLAPDRMLWATNWPYPEVEILPLPNSLNMLNLLGDWAPDERIRRRILVENAEAIYGFNPNQRPSAL